MPQRSSRPRGFRSSASVGVLALLLKMALVPTASAVEHVTAARVEGDTRITTAVAIAGAATGWLGGGAPGAGEDFPEHVDAVKPGEDEERRGRADSGVAGRSRRRTRPGGGHRGAVRLTYPDTVRFTLFSHEADCAVPVAFSDTNGTGHLDLADDGTPMEPFGLGQLTWEAPGGTQAHDLDAPFGTGAGVQPVPSGYFPSDRTDLEDGMAGMIARLAAGAVAGTAGTLAMDLLWYRRHRAGGGEDGFLEWEISREESFDDAGAPGQVAKKAADAVGIELPDSAAGTATNVMHWLTGIGYGLGHGVFHHRRGAITGGVLTGTGAFAHSYATLGALGVYEPIWDYDLDTLLDDLTAHLTFGLVAGVVYRLLAGRR